jgi:F-type H+-transporting ATPase subunit b
MKPRAAIAGIFMAALSPSLAYAAESGGAAQGTWGALVLYIINFALFVGILVKYLLPAGKHFFVERAAGIRDTMSKADRAFHEAQELANQAAEKLARLEAEKARLASDLADETVYQIGRIYDQAQEAAGRIKRDQELSIAALREDASRRVREALAHAAARLAFRMVAADFSAADQERLVGAFVDRLSAEARR